MSLDARPSHSATARRPLIARTMPTLAGTNTPARLIRVGAVLVVGCLLTAVVSLASGVSRQSATDEGAGRVAALTVDAAEVYSSLADADAMATSGYVAGAQEPPIVRLRYGTDIAQASDRLVKAAGELSLDDPGRAQLATVFRELPIYTSLIETARFYNRQGLPLGQSYLGSASGLMRETILPAVEQLRRQQIAELATAYGKGGAIPFAVLLIGAATLAGLIGTARRERHRTNRVLNPGLVASAGLLVVALLWWVVVTAVADTRLSAASQHGEAASALDGTRAAVLQARSNESLVLVARSGGTASDAGFTAQLTRVLGPNDTGGLLATAASAAGPNGARAIDQVRDQARRWQQAHRQLRELDDGGRYTDAVTSLIGTGPAGSRVFFQRLDVALGNALAAQRAGLVEESGAARGALTGIALGPTVLALAAAAAAAAGLASRIREYR